jgi:hypothetical protein
MNGYPVFHLIGTSDKPIIGCAHPDLADNKYGFEGGAACKIGDTYHFFSAEMSGDPFWIRMRLAHWSSPDAEHWHRRSTVFESLGQISSEDPRCSVWAPIPVFNQKTDRWDLFYVSYRSSAELTHFDGKIWRSESIVRGVDGIGGPYRDCGVVLAQDDQSESWEGQQGPDSFFPYRVGEKWYAFYGGHNIIPWSPWVVGMAMANQLEGPWCRCPELSPAPIEHHFIENPIVTKMADGRFLAVYDCAGTQETAGEYHKDDRHIGYSISADGIHWGRGRRVALNSKAEWWSTDLRTPLGLIPEGNNRFTVLFTAEERDRKFWSVGKVTLQLVE